MLEEINTVLEVLKRGGTILYPTDTVWGIGCDATNENAIKKIFEIKQRNESKSLIMLVSDEKMLNKYVNEVPANAWDLIEFSTKPLTIIYPEVKLIATNALAEDGSMGIRICGDEFCKKLIQKLNKPLISTSANISGEATPTSFSSISERIKKNVDYVVKYNQQQQKNNPPSSIIKLELNGGIKIIRK